MAPQPAGAITPLSLYNNAAGHPPRLPHIDTAIESYYPGHASSTVTPTSASAGVSAMVGDGTPPRTPSIFTPTDFGPNASGNSIERNKLDLVKVERGEDTRTTVMIKNIPNKMTDKDLKSFIDRVCPRRIDFMYLRIDFQNGAFSSSSSVYHSH